MDGYFGNIFGVAVGRNSFRFLVFPKFAIGKAFNVAASVQSDIIGEFRNFCRFRSVINFGIGYGR